MDTVNSNNSITSIYEKDYTDYFDKALFCFSIFYAIKESQLDFPDGIILVVKHLTFILSLFFSALSIVNNFKWSTYNTVMFALLLFIPLYLRLAYTSNVLGSSLLILAAYNIPFSHIVRQCIKMVALVMGIILLATALGFIEDRLYYRDVDNFENSYAHDLGFKYYSYYSYLGMGVVQCCIYLWRKNMSLSKILFLLLFSYVFFILSSTRLQLYACTAFITFCLILPYIPKRIFQSRLISYISVLVYPVICFVLYFVSKYFILSIFYDNYDELNKAMSGRLALNEEALVRYDVTLWGNNLEFDTAERTSDYFYIDSGYLHVLLGDGLVFTAIILLLYAFLTYKIYKAEAHFLFVWIILYAILNISNGFLVSLLANPILLLAFSDVESIKYDYISDDSREDTNADEDDYNDPTETKEEETKELYE